MPIEKTFADAPQFIRDDGFLSPGGSEAVACVPGDIGLAGERQLDTVSGLGGTGLLLAMRSCVRHSRTRPPLRQSDLAMSLSRRDLLAGMLTCGLGSAVAATAHGETRADIELDLLLDGSASMHQRFAEGSHWDLQASGTRLALADAEVEDLLLSQQAYVRVLVFMGEIFQHDMVFDGPIAVREDYLALLAALAGIKQPQPDLGTYQNHALEHMARLPSAAPRRVLDICSDDIVPDSILGDTLFWRDELEQAGVDVNVLAVDGSPDGAVAQNLRHKLQSRMPTSFTLPVSSWSLEPFVDAMTRKLRRELTS